jgi:NTP pyrophosphatase (non-canonical NTP hydrolase)
MREFNLIREWASKRGIYDKGDVKTQFIKLQEEIGEIAKAILKKDEAEFIDGIGDAVVVLTNLAYLGNQYFDESREETYYEDVAGDGGSKMQIQNEEWIDIEVCIESAYDEIKSRTGKMENGTFKKD